MKQYKPLRDLLLVKKIEEKKTEGGIHLPDSKRGQFIKLEILDKGPDCKGLWRKGVIVHAENMYQPLDKECGLILEQYLFAEEVNGNTN